MIALAVACFAAVLCLITWLADALSEDSDLRVTHLVILLCLIAVIFAVSRTIDNYPEQPESRMFIIPVPTPFTVCPERP